MTLSPAANVLSSKPRASTIILCMLGTLPAGYTRSRTSALLIKFDIAKAFNTIHREYILDLMQCLGFPQCWRALVSILFSSATSRVMLNSVPGDLICHGRGPTISVAIRHHHLPTASYFELAIESGLLHAIPRGSPEPLVHVCG
jgi:hypothetical protein